MSTRGRVLSTACSKHFCYGRCFVYLLLAALFLLGASNLVSLYTHNLRLIQIMPNNAPMHFNTALSFILLALGLLSAVKRYRVLLRILAALVVLCASLVFLENLFSFNTSFEQFFIKYLVHTDSYIHGRMSTNTAIGFFLAGTSLIALTTGRYTDKKRTLLIFANFFLIVLGYTAFIGYCFDISTLNQWDNANSMAWHTAFGFILWGVAFIVLALVEVKEKDYKSRAFSTTFTFFACILFFIALWQLSFLHEASVFKKTISDASSEISRDFNNKLTAECFALARLANRHSLQTKDSSYWVEDTDLYIEHHDSIYLIAEMSPEHTLSEIHVKKNLRLKESILQQIESSFPLTTHTISISPIKIDENMYFSARFPIPMGGYIIALYHVDALAHSILSNVVFANYNMQMRLNDVLITTIERDTSPSLRAQWGSEQGFTLYDAKFRLLIWPSWAMLNSYKSLTPTIILISGLILSFLVGLLVTQRQSFLLKNIELEIANKELEEFSYTIAHNLKAPLRHITGYLHLLFRDLAVKKQTKTERYMSIITYSADKMNVLIDSLLKYSSLSRIKLQKSFFSLNHVIDKVLKDLPNEKSKEVSWHISSLPSVYADEKMLVTLFTEIFANAIHFTAKNRGITIKVRAIENKQGVTIIIHDNGVGLNSKYKEEIFLLFYQLDINVDSNGVGAGLAFVRKIVERHKGEIQVESSPDRGTTFYIFFPTLDE